MSHWTEENIQREKNADKNKNIVPSYEIEKFSDIKNIFEFCDRHSSEYTIENVIEVWKKQLDVQMHFNDIEMKIRNFFIILLASLIALYGYFVKTNSVSWFIDFYFVILICIVSVLFYFIDLHWYHRLLHGSVMHTIEIEKKISEKFPFLGVSNKIKDVSFIELPKIVKKVPILIKILKKVIVDEKFQKYDRIHSNAKIEIFYKSVILAILVFFSVSSIYRFINWIFL